MKLHSVHGQNSGQNSHNGPAKTNNQYSVLMKVTTRLTYYLKVNYLRIEINPNHPGTPSGPMKTKDVTILCLENNKQTTTEITPTTTSESKILADLRAQDNQELLFWAILC
jgi:hypothetical protein